MSHRVLLGLLLLLMQACTQIPRTPSHPVAAPQEATQSFVLNGRMAIRHRGESSSANVRWEHVAGGDDILIMAPLGITLAHVRYGVEGVVMESGGKQYHSRDVETLMDNIIGWHLPLEEMSAWAQAKAYPGSQFEAGKNEDGQLVWLEQDGWIIRYQRYQGNEPRSLPSKMLLRHDDLDVQLIIDEWGQPEL